ncbi:Bug family tripartite tricarboxylate transporter substrate binding protein [Hydrogenophaga sp. OTU3427]|uniref:Bug family tripartite tricarboxylate transporter substrate binding protein n=1 Tax=Hydrogenophaga sp. OTU3427 TaxID=3043856 RepID=UPI00313CB076
MNHPLRRRLLAALALATPLMAAMPTVHAQDGWPSRPIRMVVPFPPGGSSDILGRLMAEQMGKLLNANIFVDNKPGGTTQVGTDFVAAAAPDGYTLLLAAATSFTVLPNLRKLSYGMESFETAGGIADYLAVMAVKKSLPIKNVKQFVAYAKQRPGELSFGSAGEASAGHVYGLTLARDTGIKVLHVPFRGSAAASTALVGGEIDFIIDGAITPMVKADRVEPLAVMYHKRHPDLPNVPTLHEAGFDITSAKGAGWGLLAPKGTPAPIMARLSETLQKVLQQKEVHEALQRANSIPAWQTPEEFRQGIAADRAMYSELLPAIGIRGN